MSFSLSEAVPWGRNFDEYRAMFALSDQDLGARILGCGDGPASFNAEATRRGCRVASVDPIYEFSGSEIKSRIDEVAPKIAEQLRGNLDQFVWSYFGSVDDLIAARMSAMSTFLVDYADNHSSKRYVVGSLPELPFSNRQFDLALCSHFLFLYSEQFDAGFHVQAAMELVRVASEVRIFPLLELGSAPSRHLDAVMDALDAQGLRVTRVPVPYEFQRGGNEMLCVRS